MYAAICSNLVRWLIKKRQNEFCHGLTVWTICFVDIVVSYDFFCAAVQRTNFSSLFLLRCIVYHWCWWIKLIIKQQIKIGTWDGNEIWHIQHSFTKIKLERSSR